jgi:hypothetical protein
MLNLILRNYVLEKLTGTRRVAAIALIIFLSACPSWGSVASLRDNANHGRVSLPTSNAGITVTATGGVLTCTIATVTLDAITDAISPVYSWTGPDGFTSSLRNPVVSMPGNYTVVVTDNDGQASSATALVTQNVAVPTASASAVGSLTCTQTAVTLTGSSLVSGAFYQWTGPAGFISTLQNAVTTVPGTYTLTVINPVNGCISTATASVLQNTAAPSVFASAAGTLNCKTPGVLLLGGSSVQGAIYQWIGPDGFSSTEQSTVTSLPGAHTLTVTNPANGCTRARTVTVLQDFTMPGAIASVSGVISCTSPSVTLSGVSSTSGAKFSWEGPNGFSSTQQNPVVSVPGLYRLTVTSANGCTSEAEVAVQQNATQPGATATVNGALTCTQSSVTLTGSSSVPGVIYHWSGPAGFTSTSKNTVTTSPGIYTLVVTNPTNGCTSIANVAVQQNVILPTVTAGVSGVITCDVPFVTLVGSSSTPGATFEWSGPEGFSTNEQETVTLTAGLYVLTVTHPVSGCTASVAVQVTAENCDELLTAGAANSQAVVSEEMSSVSLYPNPVKNNGTIQFTAREYGFLKLEIYDQFNVKVATLFEGTVLAGSTYSVNFEAGNFTKEMHFYRISGAGISEHGRFFVSH